MSDWPSPLNSDEREFPPEALFGMRHLLTLMLVLSRHHIYALFRHVNPMSRCQNLKSYHHRLSTLFHQPWSLSADGALVLFNAEPQSVGSSSMD